MRRKQIWQIGILVLAMTVGALAQSWENNNPVHLRGTISDVSAANVAPPGPWVIPGTWSLNLKGDSGKAEFSASLSMEESDYWVLANSKDPNDPQVRNPHTHHVELVNGVVTPLSNGFRVTGPATVTANGGPAPFGPNSTVQIDITGGALVPYSNIKVTFGGDAVAHLGMQPLDGVVRSVGR